MSQLKSVVLGFIDKNSLKKRGLADALGVSYTTLDKKLSGESELSFSEAHKLSRFMGISIDELWSLNQTEVA